MLTYYRVMSELHCIIVQAPCIYISIITQLQIMSSNMLPAQGTYKRQ